MIPPRSTIGMLMNEHQLILRMIAQMRGTAADLERGARLDPQFVPTVVDFMRTYADRCHHGKEEAILFRELAGKQLSAEDAAAMQQLIDDHVWGRQHTRELAEAAERYAEGDTSELRHIAALLNQLADFYPGHIAREDKEFFRHAERYFTHAEREAMDAECHEFDRLLIHERYRSVVEGMERLVPVEAG